jgi:hypothetical protein
MFQLLTLTIGPLTNAEVPILPAGVTTIRARSRSGKSHVPVSIIFALYGTDEYGDALDDTWTPTGAERIDVRVTTGKGAVWGRTMKATRGADGRVSRSYTRLVESPGKAPETPGSDAAMTALLPEQLTRDPELVRCILAPMVWRSLAESEGSGRKLTLLLERVLGKGDVRAEVLRLMKDAGHELGDRDAVDPKGAEEQRRKANDAQKTAKGALEEARRNLAALPADGTAEAPTDAAQERAQDVLAALTVYEDYDDAREVHDRLVKARAEAEERLAAWRKGITDLGKRPAVDAEALREASLALTRAREMTREMQAAHTRAQDRVTAAGRAVEAAEAAVDAEVKTAEEEIAAAQTKAKGLDAAGDTCPTCSRDGWEAATKARTAAWAEVERLRKALADAQAKAPGRREKAVAAARAELGKADDALTRCAVGLTKAQTEEEAAGKVQAKAATSGTEATTWDTARRALGEEPKLPDAPKAPGKPDEARPTPEAVAEAKGVLSAARDAETVAKERTKRRTDAEAAVKRAETVASSATAEAVRCDALVDAVRKAPGEIASRQLGALGDLGPCTVHFLAGGGCEVRVDGRPWGRASTGWKVYADACFRIALARAAKMEWLTVFIDDSEALKGHPWPEWKTATGKPRPVVFLQTVDADLVSSAAGVAVAAK